MATKTVKPVNRIEANGHGAILFTPMKPDFQMLRLRLVGDSRLVSHAWSVKAQQEMLDKQMKKAKQGKSAKDPVECFRQSLYRLPDGSGFGFPATAFKSCAVDAANFCELKKTEIRGAFHVVGDLIRIECGPLEEMSEQDVEYASQLKAEHAKGASMRMDMVRIAMGTSDIRFRGQFPKWAVELVIRYHAKVITPEQIINLYNVAGFAVGVGEHRPQRDGSWGLFHVE
jgi:hypothetical protein